MPGLEEAVNSCTAAVTKLTEAIMAGKSSAGAVTATAEAGKRGPGRPPKVQSVTFDQVKAIAKRVMDEKGRPVAVKLIKDHGAPELAKLDESKYPAFIAAAEVLLTQQDEGEEEEENIGL